MANVRIDENGVPKAHVYETTPPALHRSGVTQVDASDPEGTSGAIDTSGYQCCRFDIAITGSGLESLDVEVLFWNSRQELWFAGAARQFTSTGRHAIVADCRGEIIFLKVTAFSGTSFSLSADCALS